MLMRAERPVVAASGRVVHLVGRLTEGVFGFLGPATATLARSGVDQVVVLLDDARGRHLLPRFHEAVELVFAPVEPNPLRRWMRWTDVARGAVQSVPLRALHLHGVLPCVFGALLARGAGLRGSVFWSPHGTQGPGSITFASLLPWLLRPLAPRRRYWAIASDKEVAEALADVAPDAVTLVESPVEAVFFDTPRHEACHPLIVTASRAVNPRGEEAVAQAAVLLGGEALNLGFAWIGPVDALSRPRLKAADVSVVETADDAARASCMAAGWIYLAPHAPRGFPHGLAEAMALGLPCVAFDNGDHRELIRQGDTGFLWRNEADLLEQVAALIDDAGLRARVGAAAAQEARRRFSEHAFRASLLTAYDMPLVSSVRDEAHALAP